MRKPIIFFVLAITIAVIPSVAQSGGVSGTIGITSDYRFRGVSQNDLNATPQASLTWNGPDGFYAGTSLSRVDFDDHADTSVEWDIYGGKHIALDDRTDLNIEPYYYAYPDHDSTRAGFRDSYFEMISTLTRSFGRLTLAGTVAVSPDWFAQTGTAWWINANASYALNDWLTVNADAGRQWVHDLDTHHGLGFPYSVWDLGATAAWHSFALDVRYVDTTISKNGCAAFNGAGNGRWCAAAALVTLTYNFSAAEN